jgi:hypothetical protein
VAGDLDGDLRVFRIGDLEGEDLEGEEGMEERDPVELGRGRSLGGLIVAGFAAVLDCGGSGVSGGSDDAVLVQKLLRLLIRVAAVGWAEGWLTSCCWKET